MTSPTLSYGEHAPTPSLSAFVRCVWTLSGPAPAMRAPQPVVPDGCMEIVVNFGDPFARYDVDGRFLERQPRQLMVGPSTGPTVIEPTGVVDLIGVRFQPWGGASFIETPPVELRDRLLALGDVSREMERLVEPMYDEQGPGRLTTLVRQLDAAVRRRKGPDPALRAAVDMLDTRAPLPSLREIATRLGRSMRWMQRRFEQEIGLGPKALARITRVQHALGLADRHPRMSWSAVAAECGYFDHSHLVRDFRQIAGYAPSELAARAGELTDVFLDDRRLVQRR